MASRILHLLFPPRCMFCREYIPYLGDVHICQSCSKLYKKEAHINYLPDGGKYSYTLNYTPPVRRAILDFKFRHKIQNARALAQYLKPAVSVYADKRIDYAAWVPTYFYRRIKRGYNQCKLLAQYAVEDKYTAVSLLRRHGFRRSQTKVRDRAKNVKNSIRFNRFYDISGKNILLIDDIATSGATLSECRRVLLEAGANEVYCAVLAHHERFNNGKSRV